MRVLVLATAVLLFHGSSPPPPPLLGLLTLPRLFGEGACDPTPPRPVPLFDAPGGAGAGEIRTTTPYRMLADGGCEMAEVQVLQNGQRDTLPTREMGYEEPAVIVTGRVDGWTRIRLSGGEAWVADSTAGRVVWYVELVTEGMAFLTSDEPTRLHSAVDGRPEATVPARADVRVTGTATVGDVMWFEVEVLGSSPCGEDPDPPAVARGWLPAHDAAGEPTVWFHSRGC